jgi:DNA-binding MarR family transcriptional regulator
VLKVEERYDPFTYVWDTVAHQWAEAMREARSLTPLAATETILRRYFELAAFGSDRAVIRILGLDPQLAARTAQRLERAGLIRRGQRVDGIRETVSVLTDHLDQHSG